METKFVHVLHTTGRGSLEIKNDAIIFNSIEWAFNILSSLTHINIVNLKVAFVEVQNELDLSGHQYANEAEVVRFLELIFENCLFSITRLELRYFDILSYFHKVPHLISKGKFFPRLEDIKLEDMKISRDVLNIFRHVRHLRLYDPWQMEFAQTDQYTENIQFNNLESLTVFFTRHNSFIGQKTLPIESYNIKSIHIEYIFCGYFDGDEPAISISSLAHMTSLEMLTIIGGAKVYTIEDLKSFAFIKTIHYLTVPLNIITTVAQVHTLVCSAGELTEFIFLLDHFTADSREQFKPHSEHNKIKCGGARNIQYDVSYETINKKFPAYIVRKENHASLARAVTTKRPHRGMKLRAM